MLTLKKKILITVFSLLFLVFPAISNAGIFSDDSDAWNYLDIFADIVGYETPYYEYEDPEDYLIFKIYNALNVVLSFTALIFILLLIYGGYLWMLAGGREEQITKAKNVLIRATIGTIIVILAFSITYFVFKALADDPRVFGADDLETYNPQDLRVTLVNAINMLLGFAGIVAIAVILYGGFRLMVSAGAEAAVKVAKAIIYAGTIGLIIILLARAIATFVVRAVAGG